MALIYRDNGLAPDVAGGLVGLMSLIGIASSLAAPVLADRMGDARPAVTWSVLASVGGVAGLLLAPAALAILSAVLLGIGQGAALALGLFLVIDQEDPERVVGTSAMVHAVAYTIAATGPFAMGMLHTLSDGWTVPLVALLAMAGAQLLAGIAATRPPAPRLAPA
jgi:CP family cyanate transporter-like MFS transporter